jgi:carbon monoxide dehydrogenase subunit G
MKLKVAITIDVPPEQVWAELEDVSSHVHWMADAESIEFLTHRTHGVDTTFVCHTRVGPLRLRDVMTITEWSPNRAMGVSHEGMVHGTGRFVLKSRRGGRTRFVWRERLRFPWWMGGPIGAGAAWPVLRWVWRRNLRRLKARCEA